jgi:hypothetical protein
MSIKKRKGKTALGNENPFAMDNDFTSDLTKLEDAFSGNPLKVLRQKHVTNLGRDEGSKDIVRLLECYKVYDDNALNDLRREFRRDEFGISTESEDNYNDDDA